MVEILVQYSCKGSFRYLFSKSIYFWMQIELSVETGAGPGMRVLQSMVDDLESLCLIKECRAGGMVRGEVCG